ncbi:MAG: polyprenyl synthetase family protein, partial [Actinobacteria bacterium]|nr:polyprenyl synthetase family protein [Candidatus Fonsibacter lacus]
MLSGSRLEIDRALDLFLTGAHRELIAIDSALTEVSIALKEFLAGGKRLRPLFAVAGSIGAGGSADDPTLFRAAASLELLQACALIHDDMMDGSDTRRGAPSMHRRFEENHRARSGLGDSENFGSATALLLGDLALVWSTQALNQAGLNDSQLRAVNPIFDIMRVELMAGQYLDIHGGSRPQMSVADALKIATFKSGKYTIERPLHFGAALAGADMELLTIYSAYGNPLGIAFQLRDDLLGVFGDSSVTGKPAGDDLLEGKRTALVAYAQERFSTSESQEFFELFGKKNL